VKIKLIRKIETVALLVSGLAATFAFFYDGTSSGWPPGLILQNVGLILQLWFPYIVFFAASRLLSRYRPQLPFSLLSCILAALMLIQTLYTYSHVLHGVKGGPTYYWLFTFSPLGMTIVWFGMLLLGGVVIEATLRLMRRRA
jgi:hypothetical protein